MRIDILPDEVLLEIFDNYKQPSWLDKRGSEAWQSLVHVCRRWRNLIFESPRRLDLQLVCTPETRLKDTLDIWPAFPLIVRGTVDFDRSSSPSNTDNVIAALGHVNRVRQVDLYLGHWQFDSVLAPMHVSFPELTDLWLFALYDDALAIPDSFLGGSAPRLRSFTLTSIPFPGLPKLLLSATQLVELHLYRIPRSGYISPIAMATLLSVSPSLETVSLRFRSPQSHLDGESQSLLPKKRFVFPALNHFRFKGVTEYLEEIVTRIETPQIAEIDIYFFNETGFDCPRLAQFINFTPILSNLDEAHVQFGYSSASVILRYRTTKSDFNELRNNVPSRDRDWQPRISSVVQICSSSLLPHVMIEDLYLKYRDWRPVSKIDAFENNLWLELLLPFIAVKNLYLSREFAADIAAALRGLVGDRLTEVLPSLQNIYVEGLEPPGHFQENIGQFVAARQLFGHPITIFDWDEDSKMKSM